MHLTQTLHITSTRQQATGIANALEVPYLMNRAVFRREGSPPENSLGLKRSSRTKQHKHQVQYPDREDTGNISHTKKKRFSNNQHLTSLIQPSPNKLFGILSLILQAFNSPLTAELEECYTGALQRALAEIQSAVSIYNRQQQILNVLRCKTVLNEQYNKTFSSSY